MHPQAAHCLIQNDYVEIWIPCDIVAKGGDEGDARPLGLIRGIVSSEIRDLDGEIIVQDGLDWSDALQKGPGGGFLTHEHPLGTLNIVGFPERIERTEVTADDGKTYKATVLDGAIYLDDDLGKELYKKGVVMAKAGGQRKLGYSIEGRMKPGARKRGGYVDGVKVKSVAISSQPRNKTSWWQPVMRSLTAAMNPEHPLKVDPAWLEQATWKAEALGILKAGETIGYPTQSVAGANGIASLVPQSISGGVQNATFGGPKVDKKEAEIGVDPKLLRGFTNRDIAVARILKKMPDKTWTQGIKMLSAFENARNPMSTVLS